MSIRAELGVAAAAVAPGVGALGLTLWDTHWKGGPFSLNLFKCCIASVAFVTVAVAASGGSAALCSRLSTQWHAAGWLVLSSMLGIVIGDCCWLAAMQQLGARRLILLSALKPFVAAGFGVLCLHEQLPWRALAALALTMAGVLAAALPSKAPSSTSSSSSTHETPVCVDLTELGAECGDAVEEAALLDQPVSAPVPEESSVRWWRSAVGMGWVLAALDLLLDVYGAVLTRQHGAVFTSPEINAVRFGSAAVVLLGTAAAVHLVSAVRRRAPPTWATPPADMRPAAWAAMLVGVALTTFSAPTLSTWALFRVPTFAVWNGLSALGPMWAVPLGWCLKREAISVRTAGGAAMAATGAALLGVVR